MNKTLQAFLRHFKEPTTKGFILQERKRGVEVNFEMWLNKGVPWLATCGLESKRMLDMDLGEHCGCSQDIMFKVSLESAGIRETVQKLLPMYLSEEYTGFIDVNVILGDDKAWFLENCNRFGYSAHPTFFSACCTDTFGNVIADWIDGKPRPDAFRNGFGASVNLAIEHPRPGWPILIDKKLEKNFYSYDLYKEDDQYLLSGYSADVGTLSAQGYTIQEAAENVLEHLKRQRVWFPDMGYRTDLALRDYPSSPQKRYEALMGMNLLEARVHDTEL